MEQPTELFMTARNYSYRCGNVTAIAEVDEELEPNCQIYEASPAAQHGALYRIATCRVFDD